MMTASARIAPAGDTTRQFVLKSPAPASKNPDTRCLTHLPFCVWVESEPVPAFEISLCNTCRVFYRVTRESAEEWRDATGMPIFDINYICACRGEFIE